jgi:F-type H+-transporting ATPase subunit epsilon
MNLKIQIPNKIFAAYPTVDEVIVETQQGSFGILPHRLDCFTPLAPGILTIKIEKETTYLAVDEGLMVKVGDEVLVSVRRAIGGASLGNLKESVEKDFKNLDEQEKNIRVTLSKLESTFIRTLEKLTKG